MPPRADPGGPAAGGAAGVRAAVLIIETFVGYIAVVGVLELVPWNGLPYST